MATKMKQLVDSAGNEISVNETPGLRATVPQIKLPTTAKDQTTRVVDLPSTTYNPIAVPGTPAGTIQVNQPTVQAPATQPATKTPSYLENLGAYPTLDMPTYTGYTGGVGGGGSALGSWSYGAAAPTWSYGVEAPGAFNYGIERPGDFAYDQAAPGPFQYDQVAPEYQSAIVMPGPFEYGQAEPGKFTYDQAAPGAFTYDDSGRPAAFTYESENARPGAFEYGDAPTYTNAYQDQINQMVDQILNRQAFAYDYNADPLYQQYAEAYTRNGNAAMQDTLAQISARTGGLASSYAGTAAQQTYDRYMQELNDKIPELYQLAYGMYQDEGNTMRNNLSMIQGLENTDYGRYADQLAQFNTDRNLAYNQWQYGQNQYDNDRAFAYGQWADQMNQYNQDRNFAYNQWADEVNRYNADRNFAYGQHQDELAQYNTNRNFAYNQYQDQMAQANADRSFEYQQYLNQLDQYNNDRNFAYGQYQDDVNRYLNDRNFAYGQWQDQQNLYNTDRDFAYDQYLNDVNRYNTDRNFDYNQYLTQLDQYNTDRNLSYKMYQDAVDQANVDRNFAYRAQQDALDRQDAAALREYQAAVDKWNADYQVAANKENAKNGDQVAPATSAKRSYDDLYKSGVNDYGTAYKAFIDDGYTSAEAKEMATYYADTFYKNKQKGNNGSAPLVDLPRTSAADVSTRAMMSALDNRDMFAYTTIQKVDGGFGESGYKWNGQTYATVEGLEKAIAREEPYMTDREKQLLQFQFQINGIDLSF